MGQSGVIELSPITKFLSTFVPKQDWKAWKPSRWQEKLTWQTITTFHDKDLKIIDLCHFEMTCRQLHDLTMTWAKLANDLDLTCDWWNMTEIKTIDIILPLKDEKYYDNDNKKDGS